MTAAYNSWAPLSSCQCGMWIKQKGRPAHEAAAMSGREVYLIGCLCFQ